MNRYQLAKFVSWAGRLQSRKRMQKVVFMLQAAGCPIPANYYLHHYGPYSDEVARLADEMVRNGLLTESEGEVMGNVTYSYRLPDLTSQQLQSLEQTEQGIKWAGELAPFEAKAKRLLGVEVRQLEYASTILFFKQQGNDWDQAVEKAEKFKKTTAVRDALPLAKEVLA
ncbi:MAG: hypothetical protein IAF94_01795 [Pirellulaceae bacterium]|nr:hypothetical protein [Pirellulaceae bacterium]